MNGEGMGSPYAVAAVWIGLAFTSALISMRTGVAVSLIEILVGALVGNLFHVQTTSWIDFLAGFGSGLLTFLAGAEIEPQVIAKHWKETLSIGFVSFLFPFLLALAVARFLAG